MFNIEVPQFWDLVRPNHYEDEEKQYKDRITGNTVFVHLKQDKAKKLPNGPSVFEI